MQELGAGCYAYVQPRGTWGLSNAGLVTDGEASLLVDTLFDVPRTKAMLAAFRAIASDATAHIATVVNTHHNGDHCFGNELFADSEIIASATAAREMRREPPALIEGFMRSAPVLGVLGEFLQHCFGAFEFAGIRPTHPTTTFEGRVTRTVGTRIVEIIEVGPAHTSGDVVVVVPDARTVYTGDVVFVDVHPVMWAGPVGNWIAACDLIASLAPDVVVPGHGAISDVRAVTALRAYLQFIRDETRRRYDAGLSVTEAMQDIALGDYDAWGDAERIAVNVASLYREFAGDPSPLDVPEMFRAMALVWHARRTRG